MAGTTSLAFSARYDRCTEVGSIQRSSLTASPTELAANAGENTEKTDQSDQSQITNMSNCPAALAANVPAPAEPNREESASKQSELSMRGVPLK